MAGIPIEHRVAPQNAPIEERIVRFDKRPTESELAACIGLGVTGHSSSEIKEDEKELAIFPLKVPVKNMAVFLYCLFAITLTGIVLFGPEKEIHLQPMFQGMTVLTGLIILPAVIVLLSVLNESLGDQPYLVYDKQTGIVTLPRMKKQFAVEQLEEVVFLDRFVKGTQLWQVSLLVKEESRWTYIHIYNDAGWAIGNRLRWFGIRDLHERLAIGLGIDSRIVRFNRKASRLLEDTAGTSVTKRQ